MAKKYQTLFKLNRTDMDVVEHALREQVKALSMNIIGDQANPGDSPCDKRSQVTAIHELLGKLHDQKEWFRPKKYVPRG